MPRVLEGSLGGGLFLMSEVTLYSPRCFFAQWIAATGVLFQTRFHEQEMRDQQPWLDEGFIHAGGSKHVHPKPPPWIIHKTVSTIL